MILQGFLEQLVEDLRPLGSEFIHLKVRHSTYSEVVDLQLSPSRGESWAWVCSILRINQESWARVFCGRGVWEGRYGNIGAVLDVLGLLWENGIKRTLEKIENYRPSVSRNTSSRSFLFPVSGASHATKEGCVRFRPSYRPSWIIVIRCVARWISPRRAAGCWTVRTRNSCNNSALLRRGTASARSGPIHAAISRPFCSLWLIPKPQMFLVRPQEGKLWACGAIILPPSSIDPPPPSSLVHISLALALPHVCCSFSRAQLYRRTVS